MKNVERHYIRGSCGVPARGYVKFHVLKASEGGPGQRATMSHLRAAGIKCEGQTSCYVGHSVVMVTGKYTTLKRAERIVYS